jgi:hypothetical protein
MSYSVAEAEVGIGPWLAHLATIPTYFQLLIESCSTLCGVAGTLPPVSEWYRPIEGQALGSE